jgi:small subunit ribosomal protein S6
MIFSHYESIIIVNDHLNETEARNIGARYYEILNKYANPISHISEITPVTFKFLGKKNLAYEVKGHSQGWYIVFTFWSESKNIDELDRLYRIDDDVLKFITLKLGEDEDNEIDIDKIDLNPKSEQKEPENHQPLGQNHYDYLFGYTDELKT